MNAKGLHGAVRGKVKRTTIPDPAAERARDLVCRDFTPTAPDRLWVADFTYVSTWSGWVYVAFVIDAYARRILGWRCSTSMSTQLVLDALEQEVWTRQRVGASLDSVVAHTDRGSPYVSIRYTERLDEAGIAASVGTVGDSTSWSRQTSESPDMPARFILAHDVRGFLVPVGAIREVLNSAYVRRNAVHHGECFGSCVVAIGHDGGYAHAISRISRCLDQCTEE